MEKYQNLKELNSGFCSTAYILDNDYIQLIGKREDSFDSYKIIKNNIDLLNNKITCVEYPRNMILIKPNNEYPYGSLIYPMIKGRSLSPDLATQDQLKNIAKKIIEFNFEIHNSNNHWDREETILHEIQKVDKSIQVLHQYLHEDEITLLQKFSYELKPYLNSQKNFCITHDDLYSDNLIVNEKNELIGIIDFGNMSYFLPEVDYASFWNMKDGFLDLLLEYSSENITKESVPLFILHREVCGFPYIIPEGQEEIECQLQKIRDALKYSYKIKNEKKK